ncbi:hypothetical protein GGI23_004029, partial [Coemansia sp. RSA 2559]
MDFNKLASMASSAYEKYQDSQRGSQRGSQQDEFPEGSNNDSFMQKPPQHQQQGTGGRGGSGFDMSQAISMG